MSFLSVLMIKFLIIGFFEKNATIDILDSISLVFKLILFTKILGLFVINFKDKFKKSNLI